jgi:hypothetical protein
MNAHCPVACIIVLLALKNYSKFALGLAHAKRNEQVIERIDLLSLACKSPFPSLYSQPLIFSLHQHICML